MSRWCEWLMQSSMDSFSVKCVGMAVKQKRKATSLVVIVVVIVEDVEEDKKGFHRSVRQASSTYYVNWPSFMSRGGVPCLCSDEDLLNN
jgi:hypothetical protein